MADVTFADITDIKIPNGNVIKIAETDTGRILWEKKLKVNISIEKITAPTYYEGSVKWVQCVERNNEIIFFGCGGSNRPKEENPLPGYYFTYNTATKKCSSVQNMIITRTTGADIDPISKKILVAGIGGGIYIGPNWYDYNTDVSWATLEHEYGNAREYETITSSGRFQVCWNPDLKIFWVVEGFPIDLTHLGFNTFFIDTNGKCINHSSYKPITVSQATHSIENEIQEYGYKCVCYAEGLKKFAIYIEQKIYLSSDGLSFTPYPVPSINPVSLCLSEAHLLWIPEKKVLLLFLSRSNELFLSYDGMKWERHEIPHEVIMPSIGWCPDKNLLFLFDSKKTYVTDNFISWTTIENSINIGSLGLGVLNRCIWSKSAKAFIITNGDALSDSYFYKISIK